MKFVRYRIEAVVRRNSHLNGLGIIAFCAVVILILGQKLNFFTYITVKT